MSIEKEIVEEKKVDQTQNSSNNTANNNTPFYIIIGLLVIIAILAFFAGKNYSGKNYSGINSNGPKNESSEIIKTPKDIVVTFIGDKRCSEEKCHTKEIGTKLKEIPFLTGSTFKELDFEQKEAKDIILANDIKKLPALLLNTNIIVNPAFTKEIAGFVQYLQPTKSGMYSLDIGIDYDPYGEVCDNKVDDNGDNLIDCLDPKCGKTLSCAKKVARPVADLYIMSYCPYGLQAQKGYLEVMSKLGKVADVNVKFVQYIMHGQKEADENVVQSCIQKEQKDKYVKYLECFLKEDGKNEACRKEVKIDEKKLTDCIDATKKEFKVDEKMADKSKQYPDFDLDRASALEAGVQGSPTFVLNGIKIEQIGRDAKSYADAICSSFENKPKECEQAFQNISFDPMFGFTTGNGANQANSGCGQ